MTEGSNTDLAPDGQIWVCGACGKTSKRRYGAWDTSCMTWAVLCFERVGDAPWQEVPEEVAV